MGLGLDGMQKMNGAINVDFMTEEEIHQKLDAGYKDIGKRKSTGGIGSLCRNFDSSMKQNKCEKGEEDAGCY